MNKRVLAKRILVEWFVRAISMAVLIFGVMGLLGRSHAAIESNPSDLKLYDDTLPLESSVSYISSMPQLESRIRFDRNVVAQGGKEILLKGSVCQLKVSRIKSSDRKFEEGSEYLVNKVTVKKESLVIQASNSMYQPGGFEIRCEALAGQGAPKDWRLAHVGEVISDLGGGFSITE